MTRTNLNLGTGVDGYVGVYVEAYEYSNNGSTSTFIVRGGYYNTSPYTVYADNTYINLSDRGNKALPYAIPGGYDTYLDSYTVDIPHKADGSAGSDYFTCYGYTSFSGGSGRVRVDVTTSPNTRYTVSYDGAGGTTPSSQTKIYGISLTLNGSSSRTGYTFQGWSGSDGKTYSNGSSFTGNYALTLTAIWKINTWAVSYNANGGTGAPANQTKTYGQTLTLSTSKPTKTLYDFVSWAGSDSNTYAAGGSFTGNYALTLKANWKLAYVAPTINSLQAFHCTSDGTAADDGTYIKVTIGWKVDTTIYSDNQGSGITVTIDSTNVGTISISGTSGTASQVFGGSYNGDVTSTVLITLYDTKQPGAGVSNSTQAQGAKFLIDFAPNGHVCFGGAAVDDYYMCIKENGVITWNPLNPTTSVPTSSTNIASTEYSNIITNGKNVEVDIAFKLSASIANGSTITLFTNLPKAKASFQIIVGNDGGKTDRCRITSAGVLQVYYNYFTWSTSNTFYIHASYISA